MKYLLVLLLVTAVVDLTSSNDKFICPPNGAEPKTEHVIVGLMCVSACRLKKCETGRCIGLGSTKDCVCDGCPKSASRFTKPSRPGVRF
ncbi:hypothetical protein ANCCAN_01687 [Ancylostoma caninum]|uniref:Uncharacterized protein n=1 Tax=Ancylostoma caninum TaxID=29170 RepID=A0A368H6Q7_ANCCA|nr:hypothetical protein ANCCAN_01687 [Ancylostoma caninum]